MRVWTRDLPDVVEYIANLSGGDSSFVLSVDERPVGRAEVAWTWPARAHGLLGRDGIDGALLLRPERWVHTLGMRFAIDVAFCDRDLVVLEAVRMGRHRVGRPRFRAAAVLEAQAGAFARWGLGTGSRLAVLEGVVG